MISNNAGSSSVFDQRPRDRAPTRPLEKVWGVCPACSSERIPVECCVRCNGAGGSYKEASHGP